MEYRYNYPTMTDNNGQDHLGRFTPGNKLSKGRPPGSPNKPIDPGVRIFRMEAKQRLFEEESPSTTAQRFRILLAGIISDLGGEEALSIGQMQLARRCAWISTQCEIMEQEATPVAPLNLTVYGVLTGHLCRALAMLGLKRQPRDITPTLQDYLNAVRQPQPEEEEQTE
jgi:hypothetical protein